ncbi:MAG: YbhB/YbcL family Raf kinase inhibitor-like protein, partial [Verrucomicrobia bacterium]|nr:YbhB/YbcL family Raf kinase inhibitor-like protein [Verrucomicrobiota bacterium]
LVSTEGTKTEETYQAREGRGGGQGRKPGQAGPQGGSASEGDRPPRPRDGGGEARRPNGGGGGKGGPPRETEAVSKFGPDAMKKPDASFVLTSTEVANGGALPVEYTGDGSGATLPLLWKGAPAGTKSYALIMDHLAPGNTMKHYWTMWDIPATTTSLPKNVQGVGKVGASFKGQIGYEPPHSQGPGAKTYVLTVYALSAPLQITLSPREVNRDVLLEAMKDKVLASASLSVVYTRGVAPNK